MEIKQQLRLQQQLVMTPQLQQAIKLLQMSRMELVDLVREEMLENPVLEDQIEMEDRVGEVRTVDSQPATDQQGAKDADKKTEEIDWERYLENHAMQAPVPSFRGGGDNEELPSLEATLTESEDLGEHLMWQMRMGEFAEDEMRFGSLVCGNLSDDGYLKMDGVAPEEIVPRLAAEANFDPEDAEEVLKIMQRFDPIGTGSRTLAECLKIQAEHLGMDPLVLDIIENHLGNLEKRNYQAIAKATGVTLEEVYEVIPPANIVVGAGSRATTILRAS